MTAPTGQIHEQAPFEPERVTPEPGVFYDMSFEDYLAIDAVSASSIQTLLTSFPARLLHQKESTPAMEDGRIAHALVLEGVDIEDSGQYVVTPKGFSMTHTKKHEELIARIEAEKLTPISEDRIETIRGMAEALKRDQQIMAALSNGLPEVTAVWREPDFGLLCKARFDWLPNKGAIIPDYKTTVSVDDDALERAVHNFGMAHRSAWYSDAARIAAGRGSEEKPPLYLPIFQEKTPPYFAVMRPVNPAHIELARMQIHQALALYKHCKDTGVWPGPQHFRPVNLPGWYVKKLESELGETASDAWSDAA